MVNLTTAGVSITVMVAYQDMQTDTRRNNYLFAYQIEIENTTGDIVQLLNRRWSIFDSNCERRIVEGEGVVGVQPVLHPGEKYIYTSGCNLKTDIGYMQGYYEFKNLSTGRRFKVAIPRFTLMADYRLN